jgi:hypothetical protein
VPASTVSASASATAVSEGREREHREESGEDDRRRVHASIFNARPGPLNEPHAQRSIRDVCDDAGAARTACVASLCETSTVHQFCCAES